MRLGIFAAVLFIAAPALAQSSSDQRDRQKMRAESVAGYSGPCPCPYNVMRNGRACGRNSAYSKPGGANPLCFPADISDAMLAAWRARKGQN